MDAEKILALTEQLEPIVGVLTSYKAKMVGAGFHEAIAEQMCVQLHAAIISQAFATVKRPGSR